MRGLAREIDAAISAYVRGQSGLCLVLGSYYALGLTFAGLSFGLLIGVVSGLISFIPYVGSLTAFVLSIGVAFAVDGVASNTRSGWDFGRILRRAPGTVVALSVLRDGKPKPVKLTLRELLP